MNKFIVDLPSIWSSGNDEWKHNADHTPESSENKNWKKCRSHDFIVSQHTATTIKCLKIIEQTHNTSYTCVQMHHDHEKVSLSFGEYSRI